MSSSMKMSSRRKKKPGSRNRGQRRRRGGGSTGRNAFPGVMATPSTRPSIVNRSMPAFAQRTRRYLPYAQNFVSISSGAGVSGAYVFSANGMFDPNISGTGGQPMFFDEMMRLYNHYTVISSNCKVIFTNTTSAVSAVVGLGISGSPTPVTSIEQIIESGKVSFITLLPLNVSGSAATLSASVDCARFQGISRRNLAIMADPDMRGDAASNPIEQIYFHLYVWHPFDNTIVTVAPQVLMHYDAMFHEPREGTLSLSSLKLEENKTPPSTPQKHEDLRPSGSLNRDRCGVSGVVDVGPVDDRARRIRFCECKGPRMDSWE